MTETLQFATSIALGLIIGAAALGIVWLIVGDSPGDVSESSDESGDAIVFYDSSAILDGTLPELINGAYVPVRVPQGKTVQDCVVAVRL